MQDIFEKTNSICPVCKRIIEADIVEKEGSLWMEKSCELHGSFKAKIAKHPWYYKGLDKFYKLICPQGHPRSKKNIEVYMLHPTMNCNLSCPVCVTDSGSRQINKDLPLDTIREMVNAVKEPQRIIAILGGEATVRDDLCEIIKIILKAGHRPVLFTNGLKLADIDYLRELKMSGLRDICIWLETLRDDDIYQQLRGAKLVAVKRKTLDNLKKLNMTTGLFSLLVPNINKSEIGDLLNFTQRNSFITHLLVEGYVNSGRKAFSQEEEFTVDEIIEIISNESKGFVSLEEFFLFQKIYYIARVLFFNKPACYAMHFIFLPRNNNKKIREIFQLEKFTHYLDKFEEFYRESPFKAKAYFFKKVFIRLAQNPKFLAAIARRGIYQDWHNNYFILRVGRSYTPYRYDMRQTSTRCIHGWLPSYNSEKILNYCTVVGQGIT